MGTDSLYYIMDYSGNYYRTNQSDQLVVAACEQEAAVFTFAQANRRICTGKKAAFYCVVPMEENPEQTVMPSESYASRVKELTYDEVTEQTEKNALTYDLSKLDWTEYLTHFMYLVEGLKGYRDKLAARHSDIDQKICDILHYIELCETNAQEAVDLVELLRVCRENRREIMDELHRIEYFQSNLGTSANVAKAKQALKSMKGLETRKYRPRKYDELFENCILKDRRLQRDDIYEEETYNTENKQRFCVESTDANEEEVAMIRERIYTPFDGKENDWLSFARQQAEFYRNAGQYISNLKIDITELDDEIESVLAVTEEANCNVAQGYKVFKRLKELRLARKAKAKELECLYAMTDYIDCDALADTCEANLTELEGLLGISEKEQIQLQTVENEWEKAPVQLPVQNMVG